MTYQEAAMTVIHWGKHSGKTLEEIARTDEGLLYLDWARGAGYGSRSCQEALGAYLADADVETELARALEGE
ncbi:hypothetical protein [Herbaspirillum sp.]|uniref:hypothetical protein n=1 Tax=Herbaspirillum sp. TaxID=1890675 RepID=UPI000C0AD882|nr:hypothetical protein [Herbaspirillum sp.]MAF05115.1 hypothetical protein [Herbaspirillum sp.]